jgi:hypothetical protein
LKLRVRAHAGQQEALESRAPVTAVIAGTGGGKTSNGYVDQVLEMVRFPDERWIIAEPTEKMLERVLFSSSPRLPSFIDFMKRFDPHQVFLRSKGVLRHRLGTIFFGTGERAEAWQGAHVRGIWLDEGGMMPREAFLVAFQRVGFSGGRLRITTTPYNMGWLKTDVYDRWAKGDKDYKVIEFPSSANPSFPRAVLERARRVMSPTRYKMMYEGKFGRPEGMIYDCWKPGEHVVEPFELPVGWERLGGLDFGYNHPTAGAFVARDGDGVYYLYAEHRESEKTLLYHSTVLKAKMGGMFKWWGDPSAKQQLRELQQMGIPIQPANNDVKAGIDTVYSLMAAGRFKVFNTCKWFLDELEGYVWKKGDLGFEDQPVKERDDLMDAVRYALHSAERGPKLGLVV